MGFIVIFTVANKKALNHFKTQGLSRGERIRTSDPHVPNVVR